MPSTIADKIVKDTFGALLRNQGKGFYVTLELLALIKGAKEAGGEILPAVEKVEGVKVLRRSHDFARRLLYDPDTLKEEERAHLADEVTTDTLRALMNALRVVPPGRSEEKKLPIGVMNIYSPI